MIVSFPTTLFGTSVPFSPTQIPGLQLWLDGNDPATITQSSGALSQWNDKSTNAYHAVQATGGNKPAYSATGLNSKGAMTFNGTSSFLSISSFTVPTTFTYFIVLDVISTPQSAFAAFLDTGYTTEILLGFDAGGTKVTATVNNVFATAAPSFTTGGSHQVLLTSDGTTGTAAFDATSVSYASSTAAGASVTANIGVFNSANYINATIGEIIMYQGLLSSADITVVQDYLRNKWATP